MAGHSSVHDVEVEKSWVSAASLTPRRRRSGAIGLNATWHNDTGSSPPARRGSSATSHACQRRFRSRPISSSPPIAPSPRYVTGVLSVASIAGWYRWQGAKAATRLPGDGQSCLYRRGDEGTLRPPIGGWIRASLPAERSFPGMIRNATVWTAQRLSQPGDCPSRFAASGQARHRGRHSLPTARPRHRRYVMSGCCRVMRARENGPIQPI